jgi:O-antigen ligase
MKKKAVSITQVEQNKFLRNLIFGVVAISLWFNTNFYDPFNSAKLILLCITAAWLLGYLISSFRNIPIMFPKTQFYFIILISLFNIFLLFAAMVTKPVLVGFLGDTQRRNGFLGYLSLSVILLTAFRLINKFNVLVVFKAAIITGFIMSLYGLIQISGNDFVSWNNPHNPMISTLGNPNFASAMLAILTTMSLSGLLLKSLPTVYKFAGSITSIMSLISIINSNSRQGLIALFFAIIFYLSIFSYLSNKKIGLLVICISAVSVILALLGMLQKGPLQSLLYKDSVSVRGYYWRAGIEMFKDFPITGIGVDRYGAFFKEYREVGYPLKYGFEITSSNAHNTFIQFFATAGIFVGLLYILLTVSIFVLGIKSLKFLSSEDKKILLGLLTSWIAFQSQSLISIDNLGISVWGWLLGGAILGIVTNIISLEKESTIGDFSKKRKSVKINIFQPLVSAAFLVPAIFISSQIYMAETNLYKLKGYTAYSESERNQIVNNFAKSLLENPLIDPNYAFQAAVSLYEIGQEDKAYEITKKLNSEDENNLEFLRGIVFFENLNKNTPEVIKARVKMSKIDPWNADNYLQLLILFKDQGSLDKARQMEQKILSFAPNSEISKRAIEILGSVE